MKYEWTAYEVGIVKAAWADQQGKVLLNLIINRLADYAAVTYDDSALRMARAEGRRWVGVELARIVNTETSKLIQGPDGPSRRTLTATERAVEHAIGGATPGKSRQRRRPGG